jgi:hypothetical protein
MDPDKIDVREAPPPLPLMSQEAFEKFQNDQFLPGEKDMFGFRSIPQEHDLEMFQFADGQAQAAAGQAQAAAGQAQAAAGQAQAAAGQAQAAQGPKTLAELLDLRRRQKKFTDLERQLALREISVDVYKQKVTSLNLSEDERDQAGLFLFQGQGHGHGGKRKSKKSRYNKKSKTNKRRRSRSQKRSRRRYRT